MTSLPVPRSHIAIFSNLPINDVSKIRVQTGMELIEIYYASRDLNKAAGVLACSGNLCLRTRMCCTQPTAFTQTLLTKPPSRW